jgi:NADH:ubiquinone oxidoreductase subunit 5 (subunit L)/multisubunit Na+/H+ antiporter MnhA subunit
MYILVLTAPLLGALTSGLFGRKIGERGAGIFTSSCLIISLS